MLYLSRFVGVDKYGIVDTDDDVEEIIGDDTLYGTCCDLQFDIAGVQLQEVDGMFYVNNLIPYQLPSTVTNAQLKAKMMLGVDITLFRSSIVNIRWDGMAIEKPVRVRLSDYARRVGDCILGGNAVYGMHKVTLVFDDKIDFGLDMFSGRDIDAYGISKNGIGVAFDMREVTDYVKVLRACRSFYNGILSYLAESYIDHEERKEQIISVIR